VNGASTIVGLPSSWIKWPCGDIDAEACYQPPSQAKKLSATSYLCPKNEPQRSINGVRPCIIINQGALRRHCSVIELLAAFLDKSACSNIVTRSWNERQQSANGASTIFDLASWIIKWQWGVANPQSTYRQPLCGKNTSYNIASAFYNWVPMERTQSLWRRSKLHSNEVHCAVPKLSFTWSVFSICVCIKLHQYACNVSQIWFFCL